MTAYCVAADLYDHGIPRGGLPNPGRIVSSASAATDILTLEGHGLRADQQVTFRAESGGSLPAGLVAGTTYYAIPLTDSTFQVSASSGGSAVNITTAGTNTILITSLPFDAVIEWASAMVDDFLPAHAVPLTSPYPPSVVAVTADLAAWRMLAVLGGATEGVTSKLEEAKRLLDRWAKAIPLRGGTNIPAATGLACVATAAATDPRGWIPSSGGGYLP